MSGRVSGRGVPVPQRVRRVPVRQQMADVVTDVGLLDMAAEPAGEQVAARVHDDGGQIVRHRHDALLVSLASHDQRTADAVGHDVIAVDAGDLAAPQAALGRKSDHELFRWRGLLHRGRNVLVRAWPGMRVGLLHPRHVQTRLVGSPAAFVQPMEKRRNGVPVRLARFRFPLLSREDLHDLLRGHVFGT